MSAAGWRGVGFLAVALLVAETAALPSLAGLDAMTLAALRPWRVWWLDRFALQATHASPYVAAGGAALAAVVAWGRGARADVVRLAITVVIGLLLVQELKLVLARERPTIGIWFRGGASYPSGHVVNAALLAMVAVRLAVHATSARWRRLTAVVGGVLAVVFVVLVAATRVYLRRHWATDVVAAGLLAVGVVSFGEAVGRRPVRIACFAFGGAMTLAIVLLAASTGQHVRLYSPLWIGTHDDTPRDRDDRPRLVARADVPDHPEASAAVTTSRASAWMRARWAASRKLSA